MEEIAFKNLNYFGKKYLKEYLKDKYDLEELINDSWSGFKFIFNYTFFRGRRDELSSQYSTFTFQVLQEFFEIDNNNNIFDKLENKKELFDKDIIKNIKSKNNDKQTTNSIEKKYFAEIKDKNKLIKELTTGRKIELIKGKKEKKETSLTNDKDIMMVLDFLKNLEGINRKTPINNLFIWVRDEINKGNDVYEELKCHYVNDKILCLIIRDMVSFNNIDYKEKKIDEKHLFPIDTWVVQLYAKLFEKKENGNKKIKNEDIKTDFIKKCEEYKLSVPLVAAGCWYVSANSFDSLIEILPQVLLGK